MPISKSANSNNYLTGEGIVEYDVSKNNDGTLVLERIPNHLILA